MNNPAPIFLTHEDYAKLRLLLASASRASGRPAPHGLGEELDRAVVMESALIPPDVVTLESRVEYEDVASGEIAEYVITLPERADVDERRISVLAPIGTALIGCRVGDVVRWSTPGGTCRLKIRRVTIAPAGGTASGPGTRPALRLSDLATVSSASRDSRPGATIDRDEDTP